METDIISRQSLISSLIEDNSSLPVSQVNKIVNTVFEEMSTALVCGDRVEIRGFGTFVVRVREKGITRNPKNGKKVAVNDRGSLYFRASKELIKNINFSCANDN